MDIVIVNSDNQKTSSSFNHASIPTVIVDGPQQDEIGLNAMADAMGIENRSERGLYSDELKTLLQYARSNASSDSQESLKWAIRKLEIKLGTPPLSENKIRFIRNYAYLLMEEQRIKGRLKNFKFKR